MKVGQLDLVAEYQSLKPEIDAAIQRVLESGTFIMGPEVAAFENEMAAYLHVKHVIGVANGTDALQIAFMASDLQPGDEIITTPFTFIATIETMALLKLKPVFVDIDPTTFLMDLNQIEAKLTPKTKAIVPVHLYGLCADLDALNALAGKHNLFLIEDSAQAIGATHKGRAAGSVGTCGTFSFFPSKNLGAYGDAGMMTTNSDSFAEKTRMIMAHGAKTKYYHDIIGVNSRLDALQAAILRAKLPHTDRWNDERRRIADQYRSLLKDGDIILPVESAGCRHIYHQFTIRSSRRDALQKHLADHGVSCGIHYPVSLHLQKALAYLGYKPGDFPESERAAAQALSLPIYPQLQQAQIEHVAKTILSFGA